MTENLPNSNKLDSSCFFCAKRSKVFDVLTEDELAKINCAKVSVHFRSNEILFKSGTPAYNFFCITGGLVKLLIDSSNEDELVIVNLVKPVNYIFDPGYFLSKSHQLTAVTLKETKVCLIDVNIMLKTIASNAAFGFEYMKHMSGQYSRMLHRIKIHSRRQVFGRMADLLLMLSEEIYESDEINLDLTRQDLADLSRMTKESAIRVLKHFEKDGIIRLNGNKIKLNDVQKLHEIRKVG